VEEADEEEEALPKGAVGKLEPDTVSASTLITADLSFDFLDVVVSMRLKGERRAIDTS